MARGVAIAGGGPAGLMTALESALLLHAAGECGGRAG